MSASRELSEISAEHVGHGIGVGRDLRLAARLLGKTLADLAQSRRDQLAGKRACRVRGFRQRLPHERRDNPLTGGPRVVRLGRVAIERCGIAQREAYCSLLALGTDEGMDQRAE